MRSVTFAEASRISQSSSHEYATKVHPDYSYGPAANGGFLVSLLWKSVATHFQTTLAKSNQTDTITFHVEFLLPVAVGDVTIKIEDVRVGKASSTVHATLHQKGKQRMGAYFTNVNRSLSKGITNSMEQRGMDKLDPPVPPVDHDALLKHQDKYWTYFQTPYREDANNKALSNITFSIQKEPCPDKSITQMWLGLTNPDERWTMDMLPIGCDMYIPAIENYFPDSDRSVQAFAKQALDWAANGVPKQENMEWSQPRWYTTVNMTVEVKRALPEAGVKWLFCRMKTTEVIDGRLDVQGQIWDEQGRLIAVAQYVWFAVEMGKSVVHRARKEGKEKSKM